MKNLRHDVLPYDSSHPGAQWAVPERTLFCVCTKSKQPALKAGQWRRLSNCPDMGFYLEVRVHDEPSQDKSISSFGLFFYFTFYFFGHMAQPVGS